MTTTNEEIITSMTTTKEQEEQMKLALENEEEEKEKEVKRQLVLNTVRQYCTSSSKFQGLSDIGKVLEGHTADGEEEKNNDDSLSLLECKMIAGGKTNYSYKLFLQNDPSKAVFAKIAFDFALWNPDRSVFYDVKRMDNEFELMERCSILMKESETGFTPIAQPYKLIDIDEHSKIIITEWAEGDEQWGNQFIDGLVDKRVLSKVAKSLATLNTIEDFDPMFNDNARPCILSLGPHCKTVFEEMIGRSTTVAEPYDLSIQLAKEIGQEEFNYMIDTRSAQFMNDRRCMIHNDSHCFNILVEPKPSISTLENFGPQGNVYICDWEMAVAGPPGADPGIFMSFPIACAICHAMNGQKDAAYHIVDCIHEFWNHYESYVLEMKKAGTYTVFDENMKSGSNGDEDAFMTELYRTTLGYASFYLYNVFYQLNIFHDTMPVQDLSSEFVSRAKGSYASIGLQLMKFAFGSDRDDADLTLEESKSFFNDLITSEIEKLLGVATAAASKPHRPRRSSMLRMTEKRVSVSEEIITQVQRRMSQQQQQEL